MDDDEIEQPDPDEFQRAYDRALNFLSYRPRSVHEVRRYFRTRRVPEEISAAVVERLTHVGFLNDAEFAHFWAGNRERFSPRGNRAIVYELRAKGVGHEDIEQALTDLPDERERALRAARKRASVLATRSAEDAEARIRDHLVRRGFSYADSSWAARIALAPEVAGSEPG